MKQTNIPFLIEVADAIGATSIKSELESLSLRANNVNAPVLLPFVGEFSSGKTTLINALTDSHALETATRPTTATIYEVHFGAPSNCADILYEDGHHVHTDDITSLKNDSLSEAKVVTVFDTSTKVSSSTIIVDTPGISSPDPKHKQTLVDFLPSADGIILIIDINQQLTKSLTDFIKSVKLSNREIYAVLTKADTKSPSEIEAAKVYFAENGGIATHNLAAVSATTGQLSELGLILKDIETRKAEILQKVDEKRLDNIADRLNEIISDLLTASKGDNVIEEKIREQRRHLEIINRQIDRLCSSVEHSIGGLDRELSRRFEDQITSQLTTLLNTGSQNYDSEAVSAINLTASTILGDYRRRIMELIAEESSAPVKEGEISLSALTGIDLSSISISGLSYGLNLNEIGHEHDKWIKYGVIAVGTAAAVAGAVAVGGGAVGGALALDTAADIADTVSDVGSIMSNRKSVSRIENAVKYGQTALDKYAAIDQFNQQGYGNTGTGKGLIDSFAGFIAEKTMSKPQRSRAIRLYLDNTLLPEFNEQLSSASSAVIEIVRECLKQEAQASINESTRILEELKSELKDKRNEIMKRMEVLRQLQTRLLTLE